MQEFFRYLFYVTVFITGAAVLVVEVVAVRVLSPYFGTSLFVLSSVLTTILLALSVGYYAGGRLSDRFPFHAPLYTIITASGLSLLLMQNLAVRILPAAGATFSIFSGPLVLSLLFFFIPAFLLGIVSPYIIKLQSLATSGDRVGSVVGATFFWGTLGSIFGSLISGFYLIPFIGIQMSLAGTGVALVLLGLFGEHILNVLLKHELSFVASVTRRAIFVCIALIGMLVLLGFVATSHQTIQNARIIYESEGLYSHILVYEANYLGKEMRALKRDTNNSSATFVDTHDLVYGYTQFAPLYSILKPDSEHFLLIGGGAYSIPRTLVAMDEHITVDVVEIEPILFELAQTYFDLSDVSRIENHVADGRVFLSKTDMVYDVIFSDAFGTDLGVPHHLASKEFFDEAKNHLTKDGLFMLNFVGTLNGEPVSLTGSMIKTIMAVFPNTKVYAFNKAYPSTLQNIMVISRNGERPIDLEGVRIHATNGVELSVPALALSLEDLAFEHEIMLTDDRAPLEYLMVKQY